MANRFRLVLVLSYLSALCSCIPFGLSNSEAVHETEAVFLRDAAKCGDSYYRKKTGMTLYEFKDVTFSVKEADLTDADRRNGTEWKGVASVSSKLERWYDPMNGRWSDWRSPQSANCGQYALEKRQGKWIGFDSGQLVVMPAIKSLTCDQIPR